MKTELFAAAGIAFAICACKPATQAENSTASLPGSSLTAGSELTCEIAEDLEPDANVTSANDGTGLFLGDDSEPESTKNGSVQYTIKNSTSPAIKLLLGIAQTKNGKCYKSRPEALSLGEGRTSWKGSLPWTDVSLVITDAASNRELASIPFSFSSDDKLRHILEVIEDGRKVKMTSWNIYKQRAQTETVVTLQSAEAAKDKAIAVSPK